MPTTDNLYAITYTDSLHGFIPVSNGAIIESSDGGVNWHTVLTGTTYTLADICFPTASIGYSVGNNGAVVKTVDAGNTWSVVSSPTTNTLRGVCFLNPDTGFICGAGEVIFRTTDAGGTWVQQSSGAWWLRQFSFPTPQIGYCVGDNLTVFKTTNGGLTWNQMAGSGGTNLTDVKFLSVDTGFVCGYNGYAAKTFNGGLTWQVLNTGTTANYEGLWFFNSQEGYCVGPLSTIVHTFDGGATWVQETSGTSVSLKQLFFINPHKGFICGFGGTLLENCLPAPGTITGPSSVCQGDSGKIYTVAPVPSATGYTWSVPTGVLITSGNNTNTITVKYTGSSVSGSFSVNAFNAYCPGAPSAPFPVTVNAAPVPAINGTAQVCQNSTDVYTTQAGMTGYLWSVSAGGTITAGGTATSNTVTVTWNTVGVQTISVNYTNVNGCTAALPVEFNVTVNDLPVPAVTGPASVCLSSTGNVYTTQAGMTGYTWSVSAGGLITSGGSATDNSVTISWNVTGIQHIYLNYANPDGCTADNPVDYPVTVSPNLNVTVTISSSNNVCSGTPVTFTAVPTNGGIPSYQWKVDGINAGTDTFTFTYIPLDGDVVTCLLTSSLTTCTSNNPAASNAIVMVVDQNAPVTVTLTAAPATICLGSPATFTAHPGNGGTAPSYQWTVNGAGVGTNSDIYSYTPLDGDMVSCTLTSSEACTTNNPALSIPFQVSVTPELPVNVMVAASSNPFCPGSPVTFTATPIHGGITPAYQWKVNGINSGANSNLLTYTPSDGDSVRCIVNSSLSCVIGNPASSTEIIMSGTLGSTVSFISCFDTITTVNAQPIKLKGGTPMGGIYSGPGVNSGTGIFSPAIAGAGTKTITYTYSNAALCSISKGIHIIVQPTPVFTCGNDLNDIRDNNEYPTVQIGTQCWMSSNLNFGTIIASSQEQWDNCIPEKYCYNDNPTSCNNQGGLYKWDELMQYDNTPGAQGFCPPGWHVPAENDWNILFSNWINNGFAGNPLKYSGYSGFNALLSGARHINKNWDFQGFATFLWSSSPINSAQAWAHGINDVDPSVSAYPSSRVNAFSIRCVEN